jgi:hypothetical protein
MAFQSGVAAAGSGPYVLLTWAVALVLVGSVLVFVVAFVLEAVRAVRFSRMVRAMERRSSSPRASSPRGQAHPGKPSPRAETRVATIARTSPASVSGGIHAWIVNPMREPDLGRTVAVGRSRIQLLAAVAEPKASPGDAGTLPAEQLQRQRVPALPQNSVSALHSTLASMSLVRTRRAHRVSSARSVARSSGTVAGDRLSAHPKEVQKSGGVPACAH